MHNKDEIFLQASKIEAEFINGNRIKTTSMKDVYEASEAAADEINAKESEKNSKLSERYHDFCNWCPEIDCYVFGNEVQLEWSKTADAGFYKIEVYRGNVNDYSFAYSEPFIEKEIKENTIIIYKLRRGYYTFVIYAYPKEKIKFAHEHSKRAYVQKRINM